MPQPAVVAGLAVRGASVAASIPLLRRGMALGSVSTGPTGGYNDPEELAICDESEEQHAKDRQNAEKLEQQGGSGVGQMSQSELAEALVHESREAAAEHQEDAGDASKVEGDTLTDRNILEGKETGHTTSV